MAFDRQKIKAAVGALAQEGVFIGTSSWKYPGWMGQLYEQDRYIYRGRFSESRFEKLCLTEYAQVFKSVCVDAAYYKFPDHRYLDALASQVPEDFQFAFKVTDEITVKRFPNLPRFGPRAGKPNAGFLNPDLFMSAFLDPCLPFQPRTGLLIFEFSRFYPADFERGRDFVQALDTFLARLPKGWRYGVEIRNQNFLRDDYFAALARHGVAHIYSSWEDMPPLNEQIELPGSRTTADFLGARLLLKPGRKYEDAVKLFQPYSEIKDPCPEARQAGAQLVKRAAASGGRTKAFVYVNNRLEGNALQTIAEMLGI